MLAVSLTDPPNPLGSLTVKNVHVLRVDIDVGKEVRPHETVVTLRVLARQRHVLIHVEGDHVLEADLSLLVKHYQLLVRGHRRAASG